MSSINYNYIIEESLNEVYVFDADTLKFINVNRCAREQLGYSLDELMQMTPLDIKPEYTSISFPKLIAPLKSGEKKKIIFWTVHQRKNGTTYPIEVHYQLETFDGHRVFVALILDITEQKRIENYNIGLSRIFNDSLNEIYIFDAVTLKFIEVNQGACHNLGYTLNELQQMTPLDIKPEMTPETFATLIMPLRLGQKEKLEFITVHQRKDDSQYPVEVHLQLSTFEAKPVFVAIILDITERQRSQQFMLESAVKSERIEILKQFINDTSHEFRTPLSVINTKLYLLKRKLSDENLTKHLTIIEEQVVRLEGLINGLHQLSQLDAIDAITLQPVSISSVLNDVLQDLSVRLSDDERTISCQIDDGINIIDADEEKLRQALYQILKNAFIYSSSPSHIEVLVSVEDEHLHIDIHDNGEGIPESEQQKIFQRLYRIDTSRNSQTGGAGLGLAIAQRIVELHHGSVHVKSRLGEGTCFCIQLPLSPIDTRHSTQLTLIV